MRQLYIIKGMTCNGCRSGVEKMLRDVQGVTEVAVSLEEEIAIIDAETSLTLAAVRRALPEKYTIATKTVSKEYSETLEQRSGVFLGSQKEIPKNIATSKIKQLKPLFLIFLFITSAILLLHYRDSHWQNGMLDFMGLFYVIFSFFKFLDLRGFSTSFEMYDPLAKAFPIYGWIYPFIEIGLGLMFLMRFELEIALMATLVVLGVTTVGVAKTLLEKKEMQCACLGTALKLPMTEATFIENAIMMTMAIVMIIRLL